MSDQVQQERTCVIIKPDAVQRRLAGEILARFERKGLRIVAIKMMQIDRSLAERHYAVHSGKPFYKGLLDFITSGPVIVMVLEGLQAITVVRRLMGATNPVLAEAGTIRGDLAIQTSHNLVHGSDSPEAAALEIALFFQAREIVSYSQPGDPNLFM